MVENADILVPVKFRWIPFGGCREQDEIVSQKSIKGQEGNIEFPIGPKKQTW